MSYYARTTYTANGSTATFSFSFPYISTAHIKAYVNGTEDTGITFPTSSSITLSSTPANGATVLIKRISNPSARLVDFQDGSVLSASDLDQSANQNFFMAQETEDEVSSKLGINANNVYDASQSGSNLKISNVADPTSAQDVATKNYLENTWLTTANKTALTTVNANIANINAVNSNETNINSVKNNETNINTVATNMPSVTTVATDIAKVIAVANDLAEAVSEVETVANDLNESTSEIDTVANAIVNVNAVGTDIASVNTLAGVSNLQNLANAHTQIVTVGNNIPAVTAFGNTYKISATAPTGIPEGTLWFDTANDIMKVYDGNAWANAGSSVNGTAQRYKFVATSGQTTFTGTDANGATLTYDSGYIDVYLNGVHLDPSDYTATNGSSIVMGSATSTNDEIYVVAFGTFNVASINAGDISSGTLNDARLPTTMAGKTLNTAIVNANTLVARGDGSSADGKITLNCSQNSHGVKIQSPAHSAAQSYTMVLPTSVGTNGQVLATNGSQTNQLSWVDAQETKPTITSSNFYISPSTSQTFTINGTNFVQFPKVEFISSTGVFTPATAVSYTSATALSVTVTLGNGAYRVKITNPDGNAGISGSAICNASTAPTWNTAQALGSFAGNFSGTLVTLSASSDSTITYSEVGSNLTTGNMTLSGANITTTDFGGSSTSPTQYSFTIRATDAEGQYLDRAFTINSTFGATGGGQFN